MTTSPPQVAVRQLRRGERERVEEVFDGLSERSRRLRFHGPKPRLSANELDWLADVESTLHRAVVAVDAESGRGVGIARFVRDDERSDGAEVAFAVVDDFQSRGLGSRLATSLRRQAKTDGVRVLRATIAPGNAAAVSLMRHLGGHVVSRFDGGSLEVAVEV